MADAFCTSSDAALALLNGGGPLTRKAGSFLGGIDIPGFPIALKADSLVSVSRRGASDGDQAVRIK